MRILVYESIPDITRSKFIKDIRSYLTELGHEVYCLVDERVYFRGERGQGDYGVINCSGPLAYNIVNEDRKRTYVFSPTDSELLQIENERRKKEYKKIVTKINPDRIIVWNGIATHHIDFKKTIDSLELSHKLYHLEMGWLPQRKFFFCDSAGVSIHSSIAQKDYSHTLNATEQKLLHHRISEFTGGQKSSRENNILIPLQLDTDSNITQFSPYKSAQEFINFLEKWLPIDYKVIIRLHPLATKREIKWNRKDFVLDTNKDIRESLLKAKYVVGINSTSLIEAMAYGCDVMAFGQGVFSSVDGLTVTPGTSFATAQKNKPQFDTFLYELLVNKQIPFSSLTGLEDALALERLKMEQSTAKIPQYPLLKFYSGLLRFYVGKILAKLNIMK